MSSTKITFGCPEINDLPLEGARVVVVKVELIVEDTVTVVDLSSADLVVDFWPIGGASAAP